MTFHPLIRTFKKNTVLFYLVTITGVLWWADFNDAQARADVLSSEEYFKPVKLSQAIDLIDETSLGQRFKMDIGLLIKSGKINLVNMETGHFGESGEGCVIKDGQYFYEGFFIDLNRSLSPTLLAITLVHEITHYQMITRIIDQHLKPVTIATLEMAAFAIQYQFIQELERLGYIELTGVFTGDKAIINSIMQLSLNAIEKKLTEATPAVIKKLITYGYPRSQLTRTLIVHPVDACQGEADSRSF